MTADVVVEDREGRPLVLAWVGLKPFPENEVNGLLAELRASDPPVPFGVIVDPDQIEIFGSNRDNGSSPLLRFSAVDVFRPIFQTSRGARRRTASRRSSGIT